MKHHEKPEGGLARERLPGRKRWELGGERTVWPTGQHFLKWFQAKLVTQDCIVNVI